MDTLVSPTKENSFNQSNDNVVSERSNININKTYMTSQNFLIGAALISIFCYGHIIGYVFNPVNRRPEGEHHRSQKNEMIEFRSELKKGIDEEINQQNDIIAEFIRINKGR
jgi:hypothetical protein